MGALSFRCVCICLALTLHRVSCDSEALRDIGDRFFQWRMQERPLQATKRNVNAYNDKLPQFSMEQMDEDKVKAESFLDELTNMTRTDFSDRETVVYAILKDMLETFIWGYEFKDFALNPVDFLDGIHRDPLKFVGELPFHTIGDYENYIARLREVPNQLRQFDNLMLSAVRKNKTLYINSVAPVVNQIELLAVSDITKSVFFSPFHKMEENDIPRSQWSDLRTDGYDAVRLLIQSYRQFRNWIKNTYIPRTRKSIMVDKRYYEACLRWHTSTSLTPEEIHQQGEEEVSRIQGEINKVLERQNFTGSLAQFFESVKDDPQYFESDPADILDKFRSIIDERIDPVLHEMFYELPRFDLRVIPMAADGPPGQYRPPSPDGRIPGTFVLNIMRPREMPIYTFMPLAIHEANPGHHLQVSHAMSEDTPDFMKYMEEPLTFQIPYAFPSYSAFTEGWALYAESLGEEFGLYEDDYELLGRYSSEIFRAGRLVVDTGIHYYGWSRDHAIEYLHNITGKTQPFIEMEVDRYITRPGEACSFKIGEMTIRRLRQEAENELGDNFNIRGFHSVVLANGYKPLSILSQSVKDWVQRLKEQSLSGSTSLTYVTSLYLSTILAIAFV